MKPPHSTTLWLDLQREDEDWEEEEDWEEDEDWEDDDELGEEEEEDEEEAANAGSALFLDPSL